MNKIKKWVERNRQKSDAEKKAVALVYSFMITLVIFVIWIFTTVYTVGISDHSIVQNQAASPINSIVNNFNSVFNNKK